MDPKTIVLSMKDALNIKLFAIGETPISAGSLAIFSLIILVTLLISQIVKRTIRRFFAKKASPLEGNGEIVQRISHYLIMLAGTVAALQTIGIDLSTLFAAGAVFAVGIGFAMQNISQNFVSGIILLVERSIKTGDILEVNDRVVKVIRIGIRATLVKTRNEEELIVPNSTLVQGVVKNYTLTDSSFLLRTEVGVIYGSDMRQVRRVLEETTHKLPWRIGEENPRIYMKEFADSAVVFSVFVWTKEPWRARHLTSELNEAIWWAFQKEGIIIAFPQLDVHFDSNFTNHLPKSSEKKAES